MPVCWDKIQTSCSLVNTGNYQAWLIVLKKNCNDIEQFFLGSVAERIVHKASQPVTNVK
ncbi:MAG: universal stress protein [Calditrichaeota bacterium]|nr:universal stress protein [Calditrichota bacterium]